MRFEHLKIGCDLPLVERGPRLSRQSETKNEEHIDPPSEGRRRAVRVGVVGVGQVLLAGVRRVDAGGLRRIDLHDASASATQIPQRDVGRGVSLFFGGRDASERRETQNDAGREEGRGTEWAVFFFFCFWGRQTSQLLGNCSRNTQRKINIVFGFFLGGMPCLGYPKLLVFLKGQPKKARGSIGQHGACSLLRLPGAPWALGGERKPWRNASFGCCPLAESDSNLSFLRVPETGSETFQEPGNPLWTTPKGPHNPGESHSRPIGLGLKTIQPEPEFGKEPNGRLLAQTFLAMNFNREPPHPDAPGFGFQWKTQALHWTPQKGFGVSKPGCLRAPNKPGASGQSNWWT